MVDDPRRGDGVVPVCAWSDLELHDVGTVASSAIVQLVVGCGDAQHAFGLVASSGDFTKPLTHGGGKPIIMNQAIAFKLANMATQIEASRLLIWRAAWMARNGGFKNAEGSMSKYYASETAVRVTEEAIQILGGYGYTREYHVERMHRDAKIHTIFEGTSEIQQLVIARAISGLRVE